MNLKSSTLLAAAAIIWLILAACGEAQRGAQPQTDGMIGVASTPTPLPTYTAIPTTVASISTPIPTHTAVPTTVISAPTPLPTHTAVPTVAALTPSSPSAPSPVATPTQLPAPRAETFSDRVWQTAVMLAEDLSPRQSATDQELDAALFLADEFEEWGYKVELQEFDAPDTSLFYVTDFSVLTPDTVYPYEVEYTYHNDQYNTVFYTLPLDPTSLTARQADSAVMGPLIHAARGTREDIDGLDLVGKIVLIERGGFPCLRRWTSPPKPERSPPWCSTTSRATSTSGSG